MPIRPPLTTDELRAIGQRRDPADVPALLWEIKRLHAMVLKAEQLVRTMPEAVGPMDMLRVSLKEQLREEPCVQDMERLRAKFKDSAP